MGPRLFQNVPGSGRLQDLVTFNVTFRNKQHSPCRSHHVASPCREKREPVTSTPSSSAMRWGRCGMATAEYLPTPTTRFFCHSQCFIDGFRRLGQGTLSTTSTLDFSVSLKPKSSGIPGETPKRVVWAPVSSGFRELSEKQNQFHLKTLSVIHLAIFGVLEMVSQWMTHNINIHCGSILLNPSWGFP